MCLRPEYIVYVYCDYVVCAYVCVLCSQSDEAEKKRSRVEQQEILNAHKLPKTI